MANGQTSDTSLLKPGETLGTPVQADSSLLKPGETLGSPVTRPPEADLAEHSWYNPADIMSGIGGGAIGTVAGVGKLVNKALPAGHQLPEIPKQYYESRNTGESIGSGIETALELIGGGQALDAATKWKHAAKIASFFSEYPRLAAVLSQGAKGAGLMGGQEFIKSGGDVESAAESAAIGGLTGGATEAALQGGKGLLQGGKGIASQILKGKNIAQEPAEEALRGGAKAAGQNIGAEASTEMRMAAKAGVNPSLRTTLEEPIEKGVTGAKIKYRAIDDAAKTDFKALTDKLEHAEEQIRLAADGSEEEAKWELARTKIMDRIKDAEKMAEAAGVPKNALAEADKQFTKASALKDVEAKVFKNTSAVKGNVTHGTKETLDVDRVVDALQKLQDNTKRGGSRLEQAFGKEGAKRLLDDLYAAQRLGVKAVRTQDWAKWIGGGLGIGAVGGEVAKHLMP